MVAAAAERGWPIDVIVERGGEHVALTLRPAVWAGEGLLGAKIGPPAAAKAEAKKGPLSFD